MSAHLRGESAKSESIFDFKIGPAFIAIIFSMLLSLAQFSYTQGQQATINENAKKSTEKLEQSDERQTNRQNNLTERLVKVETIVSTIQSSLVSIDSKLDRIARSAKLDKN